MNMPAHFHWTKGIVFNRDHGFKCLALLLISFALFTGCKKKTETVAPSQSPEAAAAPGPAETPSEPEVIQPPDNGNTDALLAELTHELHKTMIGRRMKRDFNEFVALRNLQVPPPPPGKKYAIDAHWKVVLVNQ